MSEKKKTVSEIIEEMRRELKEEDDPNAELFAPYISKKPKIVKKKTAAKKAPKKKAAVKKKPVKKKVSKKKAETKKKTVRNPSAKKKPVKRKKR